MKIKQLLTLSLIGLAIGACKRPKGGEDPANVDPEGEMVKASLAISIPNGIRTYAAPGTDDPNATEEEITANTIDLFIYQDGGSYALTYYHFDRTEGDDDDDGEEGGEGDGEGEIEPGPGQFIIDEDAGKFQTGEFDVKQGRKLVYVGINLPDLIVNRLKTGYYVNEVFEDVDLINKLTTIVEDEDPLPSRQVAFFNTEVESVNITNFSNTVINVSVSRLVAKVLVRASDGVEWGTNASWDVNGGTVSDLYFAIGQLNNQMYVSPLVGGRDPNFTGISVTGNVTPILQPVNEEDYLAVNGELDNPSEYKSSITNVHYATENTASEARHGWVTYVSVRAKFSPHRWGADSDTGELPDNGTDYDDDDAPGAGFYAVFTGDDSGGEDALGMRYFKTIDDARSFVTGRYFNEVVLGREESDYVTSNMGMSFSDNENRSERSDHYIHFYKDSYCYYRVYLNSGTGNYNVLRNTVYRATIQGVNYIGTTGPDILPGSVSGSGIGTPTYPGSWFPNNLLGSPVTADAIISPAEWKEGLSLTLELENWISDTQDYETY